MEELMTAKELCKLLKVSKSWVCRATKDGLIPHYRLGSLVRFSRTDVEIYIEKRKMEPRAKAKKEKRSKTKMIWPLDNRIGSQFCGAGGVSLFVNFSAFAEIYQNSENIS